MKYEECCYNCKHCSPKCADNADVDIKEAKCYDFELRDELAKIENGTLVELPCKVEIPLTDDGFVYNIAWDCENPPKVYRQRWIDYVYACLVGCDDNYFATKSSAEARLKELQEKTVQTYIKSKRGRK